MPYLVWKHSGKNRYLVMRWKKRIDGIPTVTKEISIGSVERLAKIIEGDMDDVDLKSYDFGATASVILMERKMGLKGIMDSVMGHHGTGHSPGDYSMIFIMNRLSDPKSKNGMHTWMQNDFASTIYGSVTSQEFWNLMERFTDAHMESIMTLVKNKLLSMGYDFSRLFVDASNMYTFMAENSMAKKGHNKAHRYDLNQISYYIAANYDYIPLFWNSYPGNVHDSKTFQDMVRQIPNEAAVIFDRGYNSSSNVSLLDGRRYIGSLIMSDHPDLVRMPVEHDSFHETEKIVYGKNHRIIVYHSTKLQNRRVRTFIKRFTKVYAKVRKIVQSGDSDALTKARFYLESRNLNETILLPDLRIDSERMKSRFETLGRNAVFTSITDMSAHDVIDLYRKRNRVEHCFRTINTMDIAFPIYHWTDQKIRVHMFLSLLAYLFLALIYNEIRKHYADASLASTTEYLKGIRVIYAARGKRVVKRVDCKSQLSEKICSGMDLKSVMD